MKKILLQTEVTTMLADTFTPVGIYLRLRDRFRDTILLESTDSHAAENSYSFIGVNAIGGIEISSLNEIEFKYPKGSNSGVYLRGRYEVQIEDNKGKEPLSTYLGGLYGFNPSQQKAVKMPDIIDLNLKVELIINRSNLQCIS